MSAAVLVQAAPKNFSTFSNTEMNPTSTVRLSAFGSSAMRSGESDMAASLSIESASQTAMSDQFSPISDDGCNHSAMARGLADPDVPLVYNDKFREHGITIQDCG